MKNFELRISEFFIRNSKFFILSWRYRLLDLAEDVRPQRVDVVFELLLVEQPQRGGDRGEQRVSVLRRVAEADDLARIRHRHGGQRDHRLREDPAEVSVIAAEREDLINGP